MGVGGMASLAAFAVISRIVPANLLVRLVARQAGQSSICEAGTASQKRRLMTHVPQRIPIELAVIGAMTAPTQRIHFASGPRHFGHRGPCLDVRFCRAMTSLAMDARLADQ